MVIPHNSFGSSPLTNCVSVRGISEKKLNADDAQRGIFRFALTVPKIFRDYLRPQLCRLHDRSKNKKKLKYFLFFLFFFDLCPHLKKKNRILPRFLVSNFLSYLLCTSFYSVIISSSAYGPALSLLLPLLLLPVVARMERDQTHSLLFRNDAKLLRRAIYLFCFFLSFPPPTNPFLIPDSALLFVFIQYLFPPPSTLRRMPVVSGCNPAALFPILPPINIRI